MVLFKEINLRLCPSTPIIKGLNDQILAEFDVVAPGKLIRIDDLNVSLSRAAAAVPFVGGPTAKAKLKAAIDKRGITLSINSGYRTFAQQFLLFRLKHLGGCNPNPVARPGTSNHESGLALDINEPLTWKPFLEDQGWRHFGPVDPPHYDFVAGGTDLRSLGIKAFQSLWNKHNPGDPLDVDGSLGTDWENSKTIKRLMKSPIDGFS
ncbi:MULTISPECIES: M15 family metallopeptidase [Microcoleaceae]|uniref:M15 family metallopeptidase n=1 Tax=Microcoleaceae TaxID=1892252 RepID=UPI001882F34D|nr:M15 family metallopeptidase [Tychonema sp. LEGE 06208]MBE9162794.1 D-alanyl-D-alanine carboxypeptidase family protein [Tychonema sp. LEGE 06208]